MIADECSKIARWFIETHNELVHDNRLKSWAEKLGIKLNNNGILDERQLFHLFVLALLWNNPGTYGAKKGEKAFRNIRDKYTLENFVRATKNESLANELRTADDSLWNPNVFNTLLFIAGGQVKGERIWKKIQHTLISPIIGNKKSDLDRLKQLYDIFNPKPSERAYLTVKTFLIFREVRIQFRNTKKFQYHPSICCIPDSRVRNALKRLNLINNIGNDFKTLRSASEIVSQHFCEGSYELYDLPLFFWEKTH